MASHTFTHLLLCEPNATEQMFISDGLTLNRVFATKFGQKPQSLVFPRNQENFLNRLPDLGIKTYRAVEVGDSSLSNTRIGNNIFQKAKRFSSGINPFITKSRAYNPTSTRASLFLRFNLPYALWRLQLGRIKNELKNLADDECLHLWFHPHNLGTDTAMKLKRLSEVVDIISSYRDNNDLEILSMADIHRNAINRLPSLKS